MNPPSEEIIQDAIYLQRRKNKAWGRLPDVDIIATRPFADLFHQIIAREIRSYFRQEIEIHEIQSPTFHLTYREYRPEICHSSIIGSGIVWVHIFPQFDGRDTFMIPDYENLTAFCLLTQQQLEMITLP